VTLIIAADTQDHLILAGDHCAVLTQQSNPGAPECVLTNYRKIYPWKYGAFAASGDVFLKINFLRLFLKNVSDGGPINLAQLAKTAKQIRTNSGVPPDISTGNIFFTAPGRVGFQLHCVSVKTDRILCEIIKPLVTQFSSADKLLEQAEYNAFNKQLRPAFFFDDIHAFHRHHLDLLTAFFAGYSAGDARVTASFDVCMLDKKTGIGTFWHMSKPPKQLAYVHLSEDESDAAPGYPYYVGGIDNSLLAGLSCQ